ncbi:MAG: 6-phosphogluconolactonase [Alicyclobacillus sp.]|nr:6-phosphogluconolactonase [Alicyclobacillus sp.]
MRVQVVARDDFPRVAADEVSPFFKPGRVICFAAGQTPLGMYAELVNRYRRGQLDPSGITAVTLDEYAGVSRGFSGSCFSTLCRHLYDPLGLSDEQVLTYDMSVSPERAVREYEVRIAALGGLDLCILGIGLNGHVGFNEPGTPRTSRTHVARLAPETVVRARAAGWVDPPLTGLTIGIQTIWESKKGFVDGEWSPQGRCHPQAPHRSAVRFTPRQFLS